MLLRAMVVTGGIAGAAGMSQLPEFSQQYVQRLGGAVDELSRFVAEFDDDAAELGFTRAAALEDLRAGGAMGAKRAESMGATLARHDRLSGDLAALQTAGPFTRAYLAARGRDSEIAAKAWKALRPAMPLTFEGAVFTGFGLAAGMAAMAVLAALMRALLWRRKTRPATPSA